MARTRWTFPKAQSKSKPAIYHCIARVVDRRFAFGPDDKEQFRIYMRMMESFSGCRVLAYCVMCNHFHLLLEVPPRPEQPLTDTDLLKRLGALYNEAFVATVAKELSEARQAVTEDKAVAGEAYVQNIHERFTYRMHDLSEFMKTLLQRFTRWHNSRTNRRGNLWEETFKSVMVEGGVASKTIAAYIDLNPVRAGIVKDPAEYRWSSYGEAIGGGGKGNGKKARAGLTRAMRAHQEVDADTAIWENEISQEYRTLLLAGAVEKFESHMTASGELLEKRKRKGMSQEQAAKETRSSGDIPLARMLRHRIKYFTDGAVIGSREFVNETFANARERFGANRKNGARKMKGSGAPASSLLWSLRDLKKGIAPTV